MRDTTNAIHEGYEKDSQGTMAVPIYMSTAYAFRDSEHAANLFALKELGNIYTRLMNPTSAVFEKRFAKLEGGVAAIATASGMSAIFSSIINLAGAGDNIIVASQVYGGTATLTTHTLKRFGIETKNFDVTNPSSLESLIDDDTKVIVFETLANPDLSIADFETITRIADKHNVITLVDNTVATPFLCKPIELGCDVVVHSTSKYISGNGTALGGIIIDSEKSGTKIKGNKRYSHFNEPDMSYHGLTYADLPFPPFILRILLSLLRDIGATPSPFNSFLHIQGLETLALRIEKHSNSALTVAKFLEKHSKVKLVNYPGLDSNKEKIRANKYLKDGKASGLLSFDVEDETLARKIVDNTKLFSVVVNIGDSKSLITHPASTTHQQMNADELKACGITSGLVRLSIGLECPNDLIEDLTAALA
ncbi:MAG: O-acetylhomoserine sulfhydrylase (EC / O-succinylhomoserine sulfhydrylase (EC [uncultured Campylobacterales bacterium]|uniref:O-acetylhomoserine sulfhydrylase ) n=1 Tax=uncultured Campylobacterales bacterium TaxID=352960 RepID=A0A6S6SC13_9BACT|nr:MAG: O-acetylhomoserine sulfhydrylase (EC / O-succinylhomoserine sulfhydrylase (EC [uncultured Campylobacterales bacterium]